MNTSTRLALAGLAIATAACDNGGATRTIGIESTGIIRGQVYFDANGSRTQDANDPPFAGALVRVLTPSGFDTLFATTTGADGVFRIPGVSVGKYRVVVDSASAGDSALVISNGPVIVTVLPDDSVEVVQAISHPLRSVAEGRLLTVGERIFLTGVAFHGRETFSDTTIHFADATGAMRASRVRPSLIAAAAGDSVMLRGRIALRLGQKVLDDVSVFVVSPSVLSTAPTLTTLSAATGGTAGALDAALVQVIDAEVIDTLTVAGDLHMTMDDGSGPVTVVLDRAADIGFRPPLPPNLYVPTNRFDLRGVLVPTGTGTWRLKPRSALDLTLR